jgi:hypothetical protein
LKKIKKIPNVVKLLLTSKKVEDVYNSLVFLRKISSIEKNPPIPQIIKSGCIPRLIQLLLMEKYAKMQYETCWILTNLMSLKDYLKCMDYIIKNMGHINLLKCLSSKNPNTREQACWALANMAGENHKIRDLLLKNGIISKLKMLAKQEKNVSCIVNIAWCISNLLSNKPIPECELICNVIPLLSFLLTHSNMEILGDTCWAISRFLEGTDEHIKRIIEWDQSFIDQLNKLLKHKKLERPIIRCFMNITSSEDKYIYMVLKNNLFLDILIKYLKQKNESRKKESLWCISNICAVDLATPYIYRMVVQYGLDKELIKVLRENKTIFVREVMFIINNIFETSDIFIMDHFIQLGLIKKLGCLLTVTDITIIIKTLSCINLILDNAMVQYNSKQIDVLINEGNSIDSFKKYFCNNNKNKFKQIVSNVFKNLKTYKSQVEQYCVENIEKLQSHKKDEIYKLGLKILETYFEIDEIEEQAEISGDFSFQQNVEKEGNFNF